MLNIVKIPTESLRQRSTEIDPALILKDEIQNLINQDFKYFSNVRNELLGFLNNTIF